jgi:hypothetical protein
MKYKYLVLFPIPEPYYIQIKEVMIKVERCNTVRCPIFLKQPHITFHRPIEGIDETVIKKTWCKVWCYKYAKPESPSVIFITLAKNTL